MVHQAFILIILSFANMLEVPACNMDDLRNSGWYCSIAPYSADVNCILCGPQCAESFTCSGDRGWHPTDNFIDHRCNPTQACFFCPIPSAEFSNCESKGERNQRICNCRHNNLKYRLFCNQDGKVTGHHVGRESIKCAAPIQGNRGGRKLSIANATTTTTTTRAVTRLEFVVNTPPSRWENQQSTPEAPSATNASTTADDEPVFNWLIIVLIAAIVSLIVVLVAVFLCMRKRNNSKRKSENLDHGHAKNAWTYNNEEPIYDDVYERCYANDSMM
ncbi:uncharacterized protein LOC135945091 [Cloeon dipterum]|uniref:uncharacterized protein LOC135945091 n=1 Tax=Cloeon dipterum TaxID=197152 RepID=UPI0032207870